MGFLEELALYVIVFVLVTGMAMWGIYRLYQWFFQLLEENLNASLIELFIIFLLFIPAILYVSYLIDKFFTELLSIPATALFMLSSFVGLPIFLLFLNYLFEKKIKKIVITLVMGGLLFPVFLISTYFTFVPLVKHYYINKSKRTEVIINSCEENQTDYNCLRVAKIYIEGDGVAQNYGLALKVYHRLADNNSSYASYKLGTIYEEGKIAQQDFEKSIQYYKKSCNLNNSRGCIKLAESYYRGRGVKQEREKAESSFFHYCLEGYEESCKLYLDIHGSNSLIKYSTDKESGNTLTDDPSIWSRAFDTSQPKNITIFKSRFKSNYSLCCTRYSYDFKFSMSQRDRRVALAELTKIESVKFKGIVSGSFVKDALINYEVYKLFDYSESSLYLFVDKRDGMMYIHGKGYIDGR